VGRTIHKKNSGATRCHQAATVLAIMLLSTMLSLTWMSKIAEDNATTAGTGPAFSAALAPNWKFITVDSSGEVGSYTSLAVDSNDRDHIGYYDRTNGDLKYATNVGGSWTNYTVDSTGDVGMFPSIAVDSNDKIHISYLDWTNADLKYATNANDSWAYYTIDSTGNVGMYSSIAVDPNNKVHISYQDWTNNVLKYATNEAGPWTTSIVDSSGDVGYYTSIAINSKNKAHISYGDETVDDELKYATNENGSWDCYMIDDSQYVGYDTSIAVDSEDNVHVSYHDEFNEELKYATNKGGSWTTYRLDDLGNVGMATSIALDSNDSVHISYSDYTDFGSSKLKYATNEGGSWEYHTLDTTGDLAWDTSIAVDSKNMVHISYTDLGNGNLKYAYGTERTVPALVASFTAVQAPGQSSLTVQFTSTASGGFEPYNYSWAFGDGNTSYLANPIHEYASGGTYSVVLVVTDSVSSSRSVHNTIEVAEEGITTIPQNNLPMLELAALAAVISVVVLIAAILHHRKSRPAPGTRESSSSVDGAEPRIVSPEEKLLRLKSMKDQGLITEEEYERQQQDLIGKW
jgi:PKD repeat protein